MQGGWGDTPYGGQPAPARRRRTGWIIGGVAALVVVLCVCVIGAVLVPLGALSLASRLIPSSAVKLAPPPCAQANATDTIPTDPSGQFTVRPIYGEVLTYASDAEGKSTNTRVHLWSVDVLGPYPPMDDIFTSSVGGVDEWAKSLGSIDPNAFRCVVQDMQQANVAGQALTTLRAAAAQVPGPVTTAYLIPWNTDKFYGASDSQSLIIPFWEPDPLNRLITRNSASDWFYMDGALDHEYLEVVRYDRLGTVDNAYLTLLDNMVTDGMADDFAAHMTGQQPQWNISASQEASIWAKYLPTINDYSNPAQESVMLGDPAQGIPNGAGYQIGDHIVAGYIARHPNVTFNQLASMSAKEIYAGSGYNG